MRWGLAEPPRWYGPARRHWSGRQAGRPAHARVAEDHHADRERREPDRHGRHQRGQHDALPALVELLRVRPPALLTIQTGINEPRYATLRAIKQAKEKQLDVVGLGELGLESGAVEAAAGSRVRSMAHPDTGEGAEMLDGPPAEVAARIAEIVKDKMSG